MDDREQQLRSDERELLYKEYSRLCERLDAHINASFTDFKMYGAVGAILAWYPIADKLSTLGVIFDTGWFIFAGFAAILLIVAIVSARDLLRQSIIYYYLTQIRRYELEIRTRLEVTNGKVFRFAEDWHRWAERAFNPIGTTLFLFFMLFVALFPTAVLAYQPKWWLSIMYIALFILVSSAYIFNMKTLDKHKLEPLDTDEQQIAQQERRWGVDS